MKIYKFRNCLMNTLERTVLKDGKRVDLTPKTFDVLQMLVERPGEIVTKDELLGTVWNGSFVEEGNLPVHVAKLRRQLDNGDSQRCIETVHGGGYRFAASVETVGAQEWQNHVVGFNRRKTDREAKALNSIAVLPLRNETRDPEHEYLADGLTESLINRLSRLTGLRVMARDTVFRYKDKDVDAKEVGDTLGVATVLTGRIRLVKDNLSIGVELVKVADGSQLWGEQFDRRISDIVEIQEEISVEITKQFRSGAGSNFGPKPNPITLNAESYRLYLKGKFFQDTHAEADLYKAVEYFAESARHDPLNVHAYVETIECYSVLYLFDYLPYTEWLARIEPYLSLLSRLNQNIDVLQVIYSRVKLHKDWDFKGAEGHLRMAMSINPSCLLARVRFSELLLRMGRFTEALGELLTVIEIDPLSIPTYKRIGRLFYCIGDFQNALKYLNDSLEMFPTDYETLILLGAVFAQTGDFYEALGVLTRSLRIENNVEALSHIGYVQARLGNKAEALKIIKQIRSYEKKGIEYSIKLAQVYIALGQKDEVYASLEKAYRNHEADLIALKFDPRWRTIRDEQLFQRLMLKIGVPVQ